MAGNGRLPYTEGIRPRRACPGGNVAGPGEPNSGPICIHPYHLCRQNAG